MSQDTNLQEDPGPAMPPAAVAMGHWQMATHTGQLEPHKPLGVSVLDMPVVLYRKQDGGLVALEDRCPHRWAPLSGGRIAGDNIVCPHHGFQFCPRGQLVDTSGKSGSPGMNSARVYPVMEKDSHVWIWMGEGLPTPTPRSEISLPVPEGTGTTTERTPWE